MNRTQDHAFTQLLAAWRRREVARDQFNIAELSSARFELDSARDRMRASMPSMTPRV
ncbi:MAG: hypothetical protein QNJ12_18845 [Ilumatobacter sp.]|uniref:hypothetical protein n=1 Tax=Ilumatobacter sp. TaxID=1967498 RepID=UPI00261A93B6|nr:hypothetical protein [Ilumatobacter sp.]MDJ0770859.1 hypothetical protein [Ilumatobacter sp.]